MHRLREQAWWSIPAATCALAVATNFATELKSSVIAWLLVALFTGALILQAWLQHSSDNKARESDARRRQADEERAAATEARHAAALTLLRTSNEREGSLALLNTDSHVVRDVTVFAFPHVEAPEHPHPTILDTRLARPVVGGWFVAEVSKLNAGEGVELLTYSTAKPACMDFRLDFWWNDYDGLRRRGYVDVRVSAGAPVFTPVSALVA